MGLITSTLGAYYQADALKGRSKSMALAAEFQETLANINARAAEFDAQQLISDSQRAAGRSDLQYRAFAAAARTRQAAAGIQAGVGSAGEVQASIELSRQTDRVSITQNGLRAASAARLRGVGSLNAATAAAASAANFRIGGRSISPVLAGFSSLLQGSGSVAQGFARDEQARIRYGGG